jgi:hypothetical protein
MTTKQLFIGWLTTIMLGSAILPLSLKVYELFEGMPFKIQGDEFAGYMIFGLMISALTSIPAMALIFVITNEWIKEIEPFQKRLRVSAATSAILIAATFFVMFSLNGSNTLEAIPMFFSYGIVSLSFHLYQCQKSYQKPQVLNFPA